MIWESKQQQMEKGWNNLVGITIQKDALLGTLDRSEHIDQKKVKVEWRGTLLNGKVHTELTEQILNTSTLW